MNVTRDRTLQLRAAKILSTHLTNLGCKHAYIGGFAWALLGSTRSTEMSNVLVQLGEGQDIMAVRRRLVEMDVHFAMTTLNFFFVQSPDADVHLPKEELLRRSKGNVCIETLAAGTLGLPSVVNPTYETNGLTILHPTILIFTKLIRWCNTHRSTRPKTLAKVRTDTQDIRFLLHFLDEKAWKIEFGAYAAKTKEELLGLVAEFQVARAEEEEGEEEEEARVLKRVMYPDDWDAMRALPVVEEESMAPPVDE